MNHLPVTSRIVADAGMHRGLHPGVLAVVSLNLAMGLGALACGALLLIDGMGMPERVLARTPFDSFLWPGVILAVAVGGYHLLAVRMLWFGHRYGTAASLVPAVVLLVWIVVETAMVRDGRMLQAIIAVWAMTELELAMRLFRDSQAHMEDSR